jgi:methylmalonyl-CoA/ethylmalonyl-CoA epimerase
MDTSFRLHHVGILVRDIRSKSEQLVNRFGYVVESAVIEDPQQTAYVQFLRLPGADHWTELVAPNSPASVLSAALDRKRGGTHHLCYEVDDIEEACRSLRAAGMSILANPVRAVAFEGRRIAWLTDRDFLLIELVEAGAGPLLQSQLIENRPKA